jgi:hypothetical protein
MSETARPALPPVAHALRRASRPIAIVLLLAFFLQVLSATTQTSLTSDEGPQLTSGYSYLATGDAHLIEFDGHPPLAKIVNALPLLLVPDLGSPGSAPSWRSDDPISLIWVTGEFLYPYRPLDRLVIAARVPVALLGVLLAALVYRWTVELFGRVAGLGALLLVAFDPNLLAHSGLATNDLAVAVGSLAAMFAFWRFLRRQAVGPALLAGLALGLALGTKLNALLLLPVQGLLAVAYAPPAERGRRLAARLGAHASRLARCVPVWAVAGLVLWASYGFELRALPGWPFPVPAGTHLILLRRVAEATGGGHPGFLMGEISTGGWWHYFPVAFAIKTPLPALLVLLAALASFLAGWRRHWADELALGVFALFYAAATVFSRLNIGYRHLLPVLPFLYVSAGRLFDPRRWAASRTGAVLAARRWVRWALSGAAAALALWLVVGTVAIWPFHLAFFNESIGGPDEGYRYLVDSNTDWGQAHRALRAYMEREGLERVRLSTYVEFGAAFDWYGIAFDPLPPLHAAPGVLPTRFNPAPGVYAISTTTLQGIFTADPEMYDWFRRREPDARIGHVMFVYNVPEPADAPRWVAQCTTPVVPLPPEALTEGLGRDDLRRAYFDCTQSWLIPEGGATSGWYALFLDTAHDAGPFVQAQLEPTRLSFEHALRTALPPFALYESAGEWARPAHEPAAPTRVGALTFLGHTVDRQSARAGETVEVWAFWRVESVPERPLSLMLHLLGPDGSAVAVGDGLGVPIDSWQAGDVVVQRHALSLPPDAPPGEYALLAGAYWLDTLERWSVEVEGRPAGGEVTLPALPVTAGGR